MQLKVSGTGTFNRGDFTATDAFFWSSINLETYGGLDTGYTPCYIEVLDGAGKKATGYIGAVGAGETLGSELIVNGGFDADTNWNKGVGWSIAGNVAVATDVSSSLYQAKDSITGWLHKFSLDLVSRTGGSFGYDIWDLSQSATLTVPATYSGYIVKRTGEDTTIYINGSAFSGTLDNVSLKRVTDPPNTAVHIVSSLNGTTRDWASIESGFDPIGIASWIIYSNYESIPSSPYIPSIPRSGREL